MTMKRTRARKDRRIDSWREQQRLAGREKVSTCSRCGNPGRHFVAPSLGEPGFFFCDPVGAAVSV